MAVGDGAKVGVNSYVSFAKESTFGTYVTGTAAIEALSVSFKTERESQKLETMYRNRGFSKRKLLNKVTSGSVEAHAHPEDSALLIMQAMGGAITSSSLTAGAFTHSISAGGMDTTTAIQSLSATVRKGNAHTFVYTGGRVNSLKISANVGELVQISAEMIYKDMSSSANDIGTALSVSSVLPFCYVDGTFRYAASEGSLTSTVAEKIQSFELTINNNLDPDAGRELGSAVPSIIPPKRRDIEFKITQRFDTTTTLDRHIQATIGAAEIYLESSSITAEANYRLQIRLPKLYQKGADPEIGGPDEVISSEIAYDVVLTDDGNTTTSRDIGMTLINTKASY